MSVFIRRFLSDPGNTVLLDIESVNILDLEPPENIRGIGSGTAIIVGEFENGPFATVTEVTSADDLLNTFGSFGYVYNGTLGNNPCARSRKADSAIAAEFWNGNGIIQLNAKKFSRLLVVRADTSVGNVSFTAIPFLVGGSSFAYQLTSGQTLILNDGSGNVTATFTGAAATVTGSSGTFPTTFAGGETLTLGYDNAANFVTTFLAADQTAAQVASRINQYAGFTFADTSGGQVRLTGRQLGTGGEVRVVSGSSGVIALLGLTIANTAGTGNVANIAAVTPAEVNTVTHAAVATINVQIQLDGSLRMITSGVSLTIGSASTATAFGFTFGVTAVATATSGIIPAGTVVQNTGGDHVYVTMQDVAVAAGNTGPYTVKVRPALDDGTAVSSTAGTITVVKSPPAIGAFTCINGSLISAALSESAIDAAYQAAMDATLDLNSVAKQANLIWSARQSNAIRSGLKNNALSASANGMFGRMAAVRPPMNTLKAVALSSSAQPGVGATRDQRVIYNYPNASTLVPIIAQVGTAGGAGFTSDGIIDVGADGFMMTILSQLNPEENPGQLTSFLGGVVGIESGANAQGFQIGDYINFKGAGIAALRFDDGSAIFQSGVTSVDPNVFPALVTIARRRMADFIEDSLALAAKAYGKKLNTVARRKSITAEINQFLGNLLSANNPASQRIAAYSVDDTTGNTPEVLAQGLFRIIIKVQTLSSLDSIVLACTVGETVQIDRLAA